MSEPMLPNEALRQQLSAFVDGELPGEETELLVRRLSRDTELKQAMSRYLLAGEALRQPRAIGPSRGFASRVAAVIDQDASPAAAPAAAAKTRAYFSSAIPWLKPAAGLALAAGVAAVTVTVYRGPLSDGNNVAAVENSQPVMAAAPRSTESSSYVVPAAASGPAVPIAAARLTNYVVAHSEYSSSLGRRNMLTGLLANDAEQAAVVQESAPHSDSKP